MATKEYQREWRKKHPGYDGKSNIVAKRWHQRHAEEINRRKRERRFALKNEVLAYYSGGIAKCASCGYSDVRALSIDHINGGGCEHRRVVKKIVSDRFYGWLKKNNFPSGHQVLCMNCQMIKAYKEKEYAKGNKLMEYV